MARSIPAAAKVFPWRAVFTFESRLIPKMNRTVESR